VKAVYHWDDNSEQSVWLASCAAIVHWQYVSLVVPVSWRNFHHILLDINWSDVIPVRLCGSASVTPVMRRARAVSSQRVPCSGVRMNQRSHKYLLGPLECYKGTPRLQILKQDAHKRKVEPNRNLSGEPSWTFPWTGCAPNAP